MSDLTDMKWTGVSGKSEETHRIAEIVAEMEKQFQEKPHDIFADAEQSLTTPVPEAILKRNRNDAKDTAMVIVARHIADGNLTMDDAAVEVAARYREYLENPKKLEATRASMVR